MVGHWKCLFGAKTTLIYKEQCKLRCVLRYTKGLDPTKTL